MNTTSNPGQPDYSRSDNLGSEATLLGHPRGLFLLFGVEMWERFSFYGMRAILGLYLAQQAIGANPGRGWTKGQASILVGWYGAMCYLMPILGGFLADKLIGTHRSMLIGAITIMMGHVVLAISGMGGMNTSPLGMSIFVFGLALIVLGTGHFKPSVSVMVGQLYSQEDVRRTNAFAIFYMGINVGAFLGQLACGFLGEKIGWHWGFGCAAVGMAFGLIMYTIGRPTYLRGIGLAPPGAWNAAPLLWVAALAIAAAFGLIYHVGALAAADSSVKDFLSQGMNKQIVGGSLAAAIAIAVIWFVAIQKEGDKGPTACIFMFMMFNALFWLAFEQAATSLNFFAMDKTDRVIFSWEYPASWFQVVNPLLVILLSPLFAWWWGWLGRRGRDPSQSVKIAVGLIFVGLGYLFMVWAGVLSKDGAKVTGLFLATTYFLHTIGELWLSPTGLAFVTKAAPVRFVSLLMGVWFISSFLAHLIGGYVASYVEDIESGKMLLPWYGIIRLGGQADFFLFFVVAAIVPALLILLFTPVFKKMLHGRG